MNIHGSSNIRVISKKLKVPIVIVFLLLHTSCATIPTNTDDQNIYKISQPAVVTTSQELDRMDIKPYVEVNSGKFASCSKEAMEFSLLCTGGGEVALFCSAVIATRIGLCGVSALMDNILSLQ